MDNISSKRSHSTEWLCELLIVAASSPFTTPYNISERLRTPRIAEDVTLHHCLQIVLADLHSLLLSPLTLPAPTQL